MPFALLAPSMQAGRLLCFGPARPMSAFLSTSGPKPRVSQRLLFPSFGPARFGPCPFFPVCDFSYYPRNVRFAEKSPYFMHLITHKWCIALK